MVRFLHVFLWVRDSGSLQGWWVSYPFRCHLRGLWDPRKISQRVCEVFGQGMDPTWIEWLVKLMLRRSSGLRSIFPIPTLIRKILSLSHFLKNTRWARLKPKLKSAQKYINSRISAVSLRASLVRVKNAIVNLSPAEFCWVRWSGSLTRWVFVRLLYHHQQRRQQFCPFVIFTPICIELHVTDNTGQLEADKKHILDTYRNRVYKCCYSQCEWHNKRSGRWWCREEKETNETEEG